MARVSKFVLNNKWDHWKIAEMLQNSLKLLYNTNRSSHKCLEDFKFGLSKNWDNWEITEKAQNYLLMAKQH